MKNRILFAAIALVAVAIWGCTKPASTPVADSSNTTAAHDHDGHDHDGHDHDHGDHSGHDHDAAETTVVSLMYCGTCGHSFKGTEHACDTDHAKCEACGLHAGAELCCKLEGDFAGKTLCGSCGQIGKTEACCKEGAEVCASCDLHKGAPLCCKLGADAAAPKEEEAAAAPAAEKAAEEAAPAKEGDE